MPELKAVVDMVSDRLIVRIFYPLALLGLGLAAPVAWMLSSEHHRRQSRQASRQVHICQAFPCAS